MLDPESVAEQPSVSPESGIEPIMERPSTAPEPVEAPVAVDPSPMVERLTDVADDETYGAAKDAEPTAGRLRAPEPLAAGGAPGLPPHWHLLGAARITEQPTQVQPSGLEPLAARSVPPRRSTVPHKRLRRHVVGALALLLVVLGLALLATAEARIPFVLQVNGAKATLLIDGQTIHANWPAGITHVAPILHPANMRLFQIDGTDVSGTGTFNPDTFQATAATSYYRFLCWLRDCASYSQWQDFSVQDDTSGRVLLTHGSGDALQTVVLPSRFTVRGTLQRPDLSGDLLFIGPQSVQLSVVPDGRGVSLNGVGLYYPLEVRPYLAEAGWTITRACLWGIVVLMAVLILSSIVFLVLSALRRCMPGTWNIPRVTERRPMRRLGSALPYLGACSILAVLLGISNFEYQRLPRVFDAINYFFQAKILSTGHLWVPAPSDALHPLFDGVFMVRALGHWFGHYPPGASLALALGMVLRVPWVVEPVLGALSVLLMARLANKWYGRPTSLLVVLLLGTSPFFLFLASSYLSHAIALFLLLVFLEGVDQTSTTGNWRWSVVGGLGYGCAGLTREFDTIIFGFAVGVFYAARIVPRLRRRWRSGTLPWRGMLGSVLGFFVPVLLCAAFYLYYDWSTTGSIFLTPRLALDAHDAWGFGPGHGWYNMHSYAAGFFVMEDQLTSLLIHLFGWPYYLTLSFFFIPLISLRLRAPDLLLYGIAAIFLLGYTGIYYDGIAFGPRYLFPSIVAYVLLTARGIVVAASLAAALLRALGPPARARAAAAISVATVLVGLFGCNVAFYLPRQFSLYYDYLEQRADGGLGYDRIHPSWMHNAIVLSDDGGFYSDVLFPLNDPYLRGDILYSSVFDVPNVYPLFVAYPHRTFYWISTYNKILRLTRMRTLPSAPTQVPMRLTQPEQPTGTGFTDLALGAGGDMYIANASDGHILQIGPTGRQVAVLSTGIPPNTPFNIAFRRGLLYWNNPTTYTYWYARPDGTGQRQLVLRPPCIACREFAFTPNGDMVFSATSGSSLYRYNARGDLVARSSPSSDLRQPTSIAVAANGRVFTYDVERRQTFAFNAALQPQGTLPFGSEWNGAATLLAAHGDWVVGTDPALQRLVAYNARTGALRDVAMTPTGDLLPIRAFGLAWNGRRLLFAARGNAAFQLVSTGAVPF